MNTQNYIQILRRFDLLDRSIAHTFARQPFINWWVSQRDFQKHLKKRMHKKEVKNKDDYRQKTWQTYCNPTSIYYLKARLPQMRDKLIFSTDSWVDIFLDNGRLITSFPLHESFEDLLHSKKNQNYFLIPITSRKKVIICQKKESHAANNSPQT